ncbi:MAG TPA: tRNA lysidine(34) synthetase TilS [Alphaproteobacteria bacterium]|nr:tRNA lysidine(34) synthetase TilS [Alphaproteobacteria bacterium]
MAFRGDELGDNEGDLESIDAAIFAKLIRQACTMPALPKFAVGVSGGADSMALALLLHDWQKSRRASVTALTVDHGLRPESAAEARQVGEWLAARGIEHHILRWETPPTDGANLQARAREARYDLLAQWCRTNGMDGLFVAHHQDDQAETFMLRLARGSGVDGLAAMRAESQYANVTICRPLLGVRKSALVQYLRRRRQPWIEDRSNDNESFARVRMRKLMSVLAEEGLTAKRLAATAAHMQDARFTLNRVRDDIISTWVHLDQAGFAVLHSKAVEDPLSDPARRTLASLLQCVGGEAYRPRFESLRELLLAMSDHAFDGKSLRGGRTLAGCRIVPRDKDTFWIYREQRDIPAPLPLTGDRVVWDGRFEARLLRGTFQPGATIGALGLDAWKKLKKNVQDSLMKGTPDGVFEMLACVRDANGLIHIPYFGLRLHDSVLDALQAAEVHNNYVIDGPFERRGLVRYWRDPSQGGFMLV